MRAVWIVKLPPAFRERASRNPVQARPGNGLLRCKSPADHCQNFCCPWKRMQVALTENAIKVNEYEVANAAQPDSIATSTLIVLKGRLEIAPCAEIAVSARLPVFISTGFLVHRSSSKTNVHPTQAAIARSSCGMLSGLIVKIAGFGGNPVTLRSRSGRQLGFGQLPRVCSTIAIFFARLMIP